MGDATRVVFRLFNGCSAVGACAETDGADEYQYSSLQLLLGNGVYNCCLVVSVACSLLN